jgi:Sulfatase
VKTADLWGSAIGLALLYTSAFCLSQIGIESSYWLPDVVAQVLYPSAIALLVLTPAAAWWLWRGYGDGRRTGPAGLIVIAALCWIALIGAFSAAGYSALSVALIVTGGAAEIETTRWVRVALVVAGIGILVLALRVIRPYWSRLLRVLAILGYAYAALALIRLIPYPRSAFAIRDAAKTGVIGPGAVTSPELGTAAAAPRARQVVWIIFDELDYNVTLGLPGGPHDPAMPNLEKLARSGVSASAAYPPARDTEVSIPALLSGYEPAGVKYDDRGDLWLETRGNGVQPFAQSASVFGRLPRGPQSAAILGYYHPYCVLFPAVHPCEAFPEANVGRWFDALAFFGQEAIATARWLPESVHYVPGALFRVFQPMFRITENTLADLPRFLALEDQSLVFIHVNLPHTPGDYVQRALHFDSVASDRENYHRNLQLVDQLVAQTVDTLQRRSARQDILLIVSADHWWRMLSPNGVQRIPWIAWHVGESEGSALQIPISTVHTADLVLDFLQGSVDNQAQIVPWWGGKSVYPPLMPSHYRYQF